MVCKKWVVAIGMFDGVHEGHRKVLEEAAGYARRCRVKSIAITFDHIPKNTLGALTTLEEKKELIKSAGIDAVKVLPFEKVRDLSPETFCRQYLSNNAVVFLGYNFRFGKDRSGDVSTVKRFAADVAVVEPVKFSGRVISSTLIKQLLHAGDIKTVNKYLGRNYRFSGATVSGFGIGKKLGYPTINIKVSPAKILPEGIFVSVTVLGGKRYRSATYIGRRPTFGAGPTAVETHILGRKSVPSESNPSVEILSKIRADMKFPSPQALATRIRKDVAACEKYFLSVSTGRTKNA